MVLRSANDWFRLLIPATHTTPRVKAIWFRGAVLYTILSPLRSMDACVILLATFGGTTSLRCQELTQDNRTRQSLALCNLWANIVFIVGVPERVLASTSLAGSLWASNIVHFLSDLWFVYSLRRLNYRDAVVQFVSSAAMLILLLLSSMFQLSRIAGKIKQQARQFGNGSMSCSRHCPRVQFRFLCWTLTARLDCDIMLWVTSMSILTIVRLDAAMPLWRHTMAVCLTLAYWIIICLLSMLSTMLARRGTGGRLKGCPHELNTFVCHNLCERMLNLVGYCSNVVMLYKTWCDQEGAITGHCKWFSGTNFVSIIMRIPRHGIEPCWYNVLQGAATEKSLLDKWRVVVLTQGIVGIVASFIQTSCGNSCKILCMTLPNPFSKSLEKRGHAIFLMIQQKPYNNENMTDWLWYNCTTSQYSSAGCVLLWSKQHL